MLLDNTLYAQFNRLIANCHHFTSIDLRYYDKPNLTRTELLDLKTRLLKVMNNDNTIQRNDRHYIMAIYTRLLDILEVL